MIIGMHHTGFVVSDIDASVAFYRDAVGLTLIGMRERDGGPISQILGYEKHAHKDSRVPLRQRPSAGANRVCQPDRRGRSHPRAQRLRRIAHRL